MSYYNAPRHHLYAIGSMHQPLSAAGRMLENLDLAESVVSTLDDITDELRAALRRAEIKEKYYGHGI